MNHFVTYDVNPGKSHTEAVRVSIEELFSCLWSERANLHLRKGEGHLVAMGYSSTRDKYERIESSFDSISTMFIDCDNGDRDDPTTWDSALLDKFKTRMKDYEFWTWETPSSTPAHPKFRAIVPLDGVIGWTPRFTKKAIASIFHEYADEGASWFEEPLAPKFSTIYHHEGNLYPSNSLKWKVIALSSEEQARENERRVAASNRQQWLLRNISSVESLRDPDGWRHFKVVKKCLEGLKDGEKDNSLHAACYAMDANGYRDKIGEFLDEVDSVEESHKNKFRIRYR